MIAPPVVQKYGRLFSILIAVRHNLDVYCLLAANADSINDIGEGRNFFEHIRGQSVEAICLDLCKIFERERGKRRQNELNSIDGIMNQLIRDRPKVVDVSKLESFLSKYGDRTTTEDWPVSLPRAISRLRSKFHDDFNLLETARGKVIAHSEYMSRIEKLPSYDVMEQLFDFCEAFYALITSTFLGGIPWNLRAATHVKSSLANVLRRYGIEEIKMAL